MTWLYAIQWNIIETTQNSEVSSIQVLLSTEMRHLGPTKQVSCLRRGSSIQGCPYIEEFLLIPPEQAAIVLIQGTASLVCVWGFSVS